MEFVFDQIEELPIEDVPVHVQDAFLRWLRHRPNEIALLRAVPLEEVPGKARGLSALKKIWHFVNRLNGQKLLLAAFVSNIERADWLKLQLAREEENPSFLVVVTGVSDINLPDMSKEELYDTALVRVEFKAIGTRAFAPNLTNIRVPDHLSRFSVLREERGFDDVRTLRRAFWLFVKQRFSNWDTSREALGKKERLRAPIVPGLSVGVRVGTGYITIWAADDGTPSGEECAGLLKSQSDKLTQSLGCKLQPGLLPFCKTYPGSLYGELDFGDAADWLKAETDRYETVLREVLGGKA